ncbi:flavin reductase family protein (plasmid) [Rhodococcus globerulus]|uniref:flavin reductase family protein n=1 Tax=Rhodococcus globerulus TaxID=33008 RepID=UPI0039EB8172
MTTTAAHLAGAPAGETMFEGVALQRLEDRGRTERALYGLTPIGLLTLAAGIEQNLTGFAVSSFLAVSLDPPLLAINVRWESSTCPVLASAKAIRISVLAVHHGPLARAMTAVNPATQFAGASFHRSSSGAIHFGDATAWLTTVPDATMTAGDHQIVTLRFTHTARTDTPHWCFTAASLVGGGDARW